MNEHGSTSSIPSGGNDGQDAQDVSRDIVWHQHVVTTSDRESRLGQRGCVVWLTGLSGCGKSTIASVLEQKLHCRGAASMLLDGDNLRHSLCAPPAGLADQHGRDLAERFGLGFGALDRQENIRRIGAVAALMASAGLITLAAFVSPYRRDRDRVRAAVCDDPLGPHGLFMEVFVDTPIEVCRHRDPKGLYEKAIAGEIKNFTGISDPYEPPESPEVHLRYEEGITPQDQADQIVAALEKQGVWTVG